MVPVNFDTVACRLEMLVESPLAVVCCWAIEDCKEVLLLWAAVRLELVVSSLELDWRTRAPLATVAMARITINTATKPPLPDDLPADAAIIGGGILGGGVEEGIMGSDMPGVMGAGCSDMLEDGCSEDGGLESSAMLGGIESGCPAGIEFC